MAQGMVIWLTGLPCAGKSTLAHALFEALTQRGLSCEVLDGDVVRQNLSRGLGFSREDRDINVKRIGFVAGLLAKHGAVAIVAAVSPYREVRQAVRSGIERFVEVHVDAPTQVCEKRDVKGMYAEARAGKRKNFTGVDDPYEPPQDPEVVVHTGQQQVSESLAAILEVLESLGYLS